MLAKCKYIALVSWVLAICKWRGQISVMRNSDSCRSHCPINYFLETFGDAWSLLIVRDLMFNGKSSYRAFKESAEGVSTNILADRLKRLEEHGVIEKAVSEENRSSFVYSLTDKGRDLAAVMLEVTAWSVRHDPSTNAPKSFSDDFARDKDAIINFAKGKSG